MNRNLAEAFHCSRFSDKVSEMRGPIVHGELLRR